MRERERQPADASQFFFPGANDEIPGVHQKLNINSTYATDTFSANVTKSQTHTTSKTRKKKIERDNVQYIRRNEVIQYLFMLKCAITSSDPLNLRGNKRNE